VQLNADSECSVKHVVAVLDIFGEVGEIDFHIESSSNSDPSSESNTEDGSAS